MVSTDQPSSPSSNTATVHVIKDRDAPNLNMKILDPKCKRALRNIGIDQMFRPDQVLSEFQSRKRKRQEQELELEGRKDAGAGNEEGDESHREAAVERGGSAKV